MKPLFRYVPYSTMDLTEGRIHRVIDGGSTKYFMCFPKKWEKSDKPTTLQTIAGPLTVYSYVVTEWEQVELQPKGQ